MDRLGTMAGYAVLNNGNKDNSFWQMRVKDIVSVKYAPAAKKKKAESSASYR